MSFNKIESWGQVISRVTSNIRPTINDLDERLFAYSGPHPRDTVEILGDSNVGKTLLVLEIIAKASAPAVFGGKGANVLIIETEHSFEIFKMMAVLEKYIQAYTHRQNMKLKTNEIFDAIHDSLKNITIIKCYSSDELELAIISLGQTLVDNANIALVIIDSIASFYWSGCTDERAIRMDTYLRNLIIKVKKITAANGVVFMYTRPLYFSTKLGNNVAGTSSVSVATIESELDYRIELSEDGMPANLMDCVDKNITYVAKIVAFKLNLNCSYRYSIDRFGIEWKL